MHSKRFPLAILIGLAVLIGAAGTATHAQERATPVARPDLALTVQDLPPGYAEAPPIGLTFSGTPVEDRAFRRATSGRGPVWLWSATFEAGTFVTAARVAGWGQELARRLNRAFLLALRESVGADIALSEWAERDPAGLGEYAALYQFHYAYLDDDGGDGALVVFSRGDILSVLAVLETDEQASADLQQYVQVVDARIRAEGRQ